MTIRRYIKGDRIIWAVVLILLIISLLSVYSSTGSLAYQYRSGNTFFYLFRQLKFILLGLVIIFFVHLVPYQVFSRVSVMAFYIAVPLLLVTMFAGTSINEATRWLQIPGTGLTIQPSDFAKVALIMYVARILAANQNNIKDFKGVFLKIALAVILTCALILPANLSTSLIVFITLFALMFVGRIPVLYLLSLIMTGALILSVFILISFAVGKEGRIHTWKSRIETYMEGGGDNYQSDQAKVAIVQGGFFGKGPGKSTQRNLLPHPYSDFVFAIIIEEYGSIFGGITILALYLWLFFRTGLIVRRSKSTYAAFLAFGLSTGLVIQAFVNMAVAVGVLPVTGQTLPLVSMGGSSILFTSLSVGMILSVSWGSKDDEQNAEADKGKNEEETGEENSDEKEPEAS
ncbi:MAG: FtsW/RodA/SpoVE family cell cycle protein [Bacteroidales bacterium]|nr:FtsW/RodA/SpoVE family cell cycle protein [Bacteroidales bacterium]MBN2699719.1 FtsW/RodA/SpoVE family cell cycle protein [Bacteroidales bacterium]